MIYGTHEPVKQFFYSIWSQLSGILTGSFAARLLKKYLKVHEKYGISCRRTHISNKICWTKWYSYGIGIIRKRRFFSVVLRGSKGWLFAAFSARKCCWDSDGSKVYNNSKKVSSFLFSVVEYLLTRAENDAVAQLLLVLHVEDVLEGEVQEGVVVLPHLYIWLTKRDSVTRFLTSGVFHESVSPKPLSIPLGSFRIFSKICGDIHSSKCTTSVVDTGGSWKKSSIIKVLIFCLDTFGK